MKQSIVLFIIALFSMCGYGQITIKELSLRDAVRLGLQNNPELRSSADKIAAAEGRLWSGISLPKPGIDVSYEYTPVNSSLKNYGERTIEISQTLEFPTLYFAKRNKFIGEIELASAQLNLTEKRIISQIKSCYYKVLSKKYQIKYAEENVDLSEDFRNKAEIRTNVGEGTHLENLTAQVQFLEAKNNLSLIKNELQSALYELNYALGFRLQTIDSSFTLTDSLVFLDHNIDQEHILKTIEENNSHIRIAELNTKIASVEKTLAWSSLLPDLNFAYFNQARDGDNGFYGVSFGLSIPLWFMFEQKGKIQEAGANLSASENDLLSVKNEINLQIREALADNQNNYNQVKLYLNTLLPQAGEIFKSALTSYAAGELTYLEFLQAKQILISSRNSFIAALYNHYLTIIKIEEITGLPLLQDIEMENK